MPIILIVAVIAVLGFVGVRLLIAQSSKPTAANSIANNQTSPANSQSSNTPANATPATQTDPNAGYIVIKEWG